MNSSRSPSRSTSGSTSRSSCALPTTTSAPASQIVEPPGAHFVEVANVGHYPEARNKKGNEPEGAEVDLTMVENGALAVENALKVAFDWKSRHNAAHGRSRELGTKVLHLTRAFHGRTGYTMSLTATTQSGVPCAGSAGFAIAARDLMTSTLAPAGPQPSRYVVMMRGAKNTSQTVLDPLGSGELGLSSVSQEPPA